MSYISDARDDLYREVYEGTYSMDELINPSDVDENADSWAEVGDERLNHEIHRSVEISINESRFENEIKHLAVLERLHDMPRVDMEHLIFDTHEEALYESYWPFDLSRMEAASKLKDMLYRGEINIESTAYIKARNLAKKALADKYDPRVDSPQR